MNLEDKFAELYAEWLTTDMPAQESLLWFFMKGAHTVVLNDIRKLEAKLGTQRTEGIKVEAELESV